MSAILSYINNQLIIKQKDKQNYLNNINLFKLINILLFYFLTFRKNVKSNFIIINKI